MRLVLVAMSLLCLAACGDDGERRGEVSSGRSFERVKLRPAGSVDGAPTGYAEYLPPGYGDGRPRPLLLFFHGAGENGDGSEDELERVRGFGIPGLIRNDRWPGSRPFIVLAPQHQGGYGSGGDGPLCPDAAEIDRFVHFAIEHYDVDRRRVYLTGTSCGAIGGWDYLGTHTNEVVAAAVLIAGDGNSAVGRANCALARVPIWAFHGGSDGTVSVYGSIRPIRLLRQCTDPVPVDLRLTVYPGVGHDSWSATYDLSAGHDIYAWFLRHRRS